MVERKLFKTKLCVLYQKGHCNRQSCSFAHGDTELRNFSAPLDGRRDYRGRDLREKLDRRHSPLRRYSPDRDARGKHASHGHSPSESLGRRNDRKRRIKHQSDGQSDISGSLKMSDGTEDHVKEKRKLSSNSKEALQLRQVQSEINVLADRKRELEINLEERTQLAHSLTLTIQDLEMELAKEKDENKRITVKVKKFIEAYSNHSRLEGELKRSQATLQKLGEKLSSDLVINGASGDDSSINIMSDAGVACNRLSSWDAQQKVTPPGKKRSRVHLEADETSNQVSPEGQGTVMGKLRLENISQRSAYKTQLHNVKKSSADLNWKNGHKTPVDEVKSTNTKGMIIPSEMTFADKPKASETALVLPSTSMAAHAAEDVEVVEMEEKLETVGNALRGGAETGIASGIPKFPFLPPPPPLYRSAYSQYKGDDQSVDVDGLGEEMVEVDIV